jgi:hypothetical protein
MFVLATSKKPYLPIWMNSAEAKPTIVRVRSPADLPRTSRSSPISADQEREAELADLGPRLPRGHAGRRGHRISRPVRRIRA